MSTSAWGAGASVANYHHEHATAVREKMVRSLCAAATAGCAPVARQCPRSQAAAESSTGCFAWARKAGADRQAIAADDGRWGGARWRGRASSGAAAFVESRPPAWSGAARARAAAGAAPRHRRRRRWRLYPTSFGAPTRPKPALGMGKLRRCAKKWDDSFIHPSSSIIRRNRASERASGVLGTQFSAVLP